MMVRFAKTMAAAALVAAAGAANAVTVFADGFESPVLGSPYFGALSTWGFGSSQGLVVNNALALPPDTPFGNQYAEIQASDFIYKSIDTTANTLYTVTFYSTSDLSNLGGGSTDALSTTSLFRAGSGTAGWSQYSFSFTAAGSSTHFRLSSVSGASVDNVTVATAVPEPETYAMMLAGLGAVGFMARRRRSK